MPHQDVGSRVAWLAQAKAAPSLAQHARRGAPGFSLPELLAVLAILAVAVLVTASFVGGRIQEARLAAAAGEFAVALRAARMIAVTRGDVVPVTVRSASGHCACPGPAECTAHPANSYEYTDVGGERRMVQVPAGVRIVASDSPILFQPNGAVQAAQPPETEFVIEQGEQVIARWIVRTSLGGIPTVVSLGVETSQAPD